MTFGPQWTGTLGLRYTQYRYRTEYGVAIPAAGPSPAVIFEPMSLDQGAPSGSLGLIYTPIKDLHLTFNVANGYRQPNAQELFFDGQASVGWVIGNPDLNPEKSISYDLGARWGAGTFAASGSAYYSTYQDLIDAISVPPVPEANGQPTYQYVNISTARIWGGEAEGEWNFRPEWRFRAALGGAVGDITSSEALQTIYGVNGSSAPLPNVPPFAGTLGLRWTDSQRRYWIEPSARYSWRTNRLPLPVQGVSQIGAFKKEWFVGDITAGWNIPSGQRLIVGVRNVADVTYRYALGSLDEPGVSFFGSLSTNF
jgi:hemoglobin/transferrin/lactoferrin receptor protein